jgi:hypothetical protein
MGVAIGFQPDLIVTRSDGTELLLVVTVGRDEADRAHVEGPLKQYMRMTSCPVGMLVVPSKVWIYRNRYLSNPQESVQASGPFWPEGSLPRSFVGTGPRAEWAARYPFVQEVRRWLENLNAPGALNALNPDLRSAVSDYLLPVLAEGELRAGVPRRMP